MHTKKRYFHLISSSLVLTALILSACQESGHTVAARIAAAGQPKDKTEEAKKADSGALDTVTVESLFAQAADLDGKTAKCLLFNSNKTEGCVIAASRFSEEVPETGVKVSFLKFAFREEGSETAFLTETVYQTKKADVGAYQNPETKEIVAVIPLTSLAVKEKVVGATFRTNYLIAVKTAVDKKDVLKLEGIASVPGVITKVTVDEKGKTVCESTAAETKDASSDIILLTGEGKYNEALAKILKGIKPVAPCW